ncbi:MAG: hypothetical protein IT584_03590, partial [Chlamydiae bacterium]|nr:hypothetical protein [Chlamydiota bacterium]
VIEQYLEDPLAEKLLQHPREPRKYLISAKDEQIIFIDQEVAKVEPPKKPEPTKRGKSTSSV